METQRLPGGGLVDTTSDTTGGFRSDLHHRGAESVAEILAHFGVKGMRWGVRKADPYSSTTNGFYKSTPTVGALSFDSDGSPAIILKVKPWSGDGSKGAGDFKKPFTVTTQNRAQAEALQQAGEKEQKKFPFHLPARAAKGAWDLARIVQQSETDSTALGQDQSRDILEHFGVKGMRWGVRRKDTGYSDGDSTIKVTTKSGKGIVKVSGGKGIDPSEDAVKVAAAKQKAKSSTTAALSNDEMKLLVGRMQLEQQYAKLMSESNQKKKSKGLEFSTWLLKSEGKAIATGKPSPIIGPTAKVVKKVLEVSSGKAATVKVK